MEIDELRSGANQQASKSEDGSEHAAGGSPGCRSLLKSEAALWLGQASNALRGTAGLCICLLPPPPHFRCDEIMCVCLATAHCMQPGLLHTQTDSSSGMATAVFGSILSLKLGTCMVRLVIGGT